MWKHIFRQKSNENGQFGGVREHIQSLKKSDHDDSVFHDFLVFLAPIDPFRNWGNRFKFVSTFGEFFITIVLTACDAVDNFIGLFEESIRAFISNRYSDQISQLELTNKMEKYLEEEGMLFKALDRALFSELIQQVIILSTQDLTELFPNATDIETNLRAILELRNAVSHNRFLLNYMDFKPCMIQHEKKGSLYANLLSFSHFLPPEISSNFIKEINGCCKTDPKLPNKTPYQTLWVLPKEVILQLNCMEPQH